MLQNQSQLGGGDSPTQFPLPHQNLFSLLSGSLWILDKQVQVVSSPSYMVLQKNYPSTEFYQVLKVSSYPLWVGGGILDLTGGGLELPQPSIALLPYPIDVTSRARQSGALGSYIRFGKTLLGTVRHQAFIEISCLGIEWE